MTTTAGNFFVMLYHPNDSIGYVPMTDDEDIARFDNYEDARMAAMNSSLGDAYGFEIFNIENGL